MTSLKLTVATGLAAATLAVPLTYMLGAQAILQSPYAEPAHNLFMSMFMPLTKAITSGHSSMSQMHGGPAAEESTMQGMNQGILGNNILGSPATMPAAGFAAVVVMGVIPLAVAAFVISWNQRSLVVAGLLGASGIILMILPELNEIKDSIEDAFAKRKLSEQRYNLLTKKNKTSDSILEGTDKTRVMKRSPL